MVGEKDKIKKIAVSSAILFLVQCTSVQATSMSDLNTALLTVSAALAVVMIAVHALKWITSENPQDRADIKKGLLYIILGLLMVYLARNIVKGVYCYSLSKVFSTATGTSCMSYV